MKPSPRAFKASSSTTILTYHYTPTYKPHLLRDHSDVLGFPQAARHATRPKEGLWWSVTANTMQGKSVVRTWAQRRLKVAILRALETRGWDRKGMLKVKTDGGLMKLQGQNVEKSNGKGKQRGDLEGTLQVYALGTILRARGEDVYREAEALVGKISRKVQGLKQLKASEVKGRRNQEDTFPS